MTDEILNLQTALAEIARVHSEHLCPDPFTRMNCKAVGTCEECRRPYPCATIKLIQASYR